MKLFDRPALVGLCAGVCALAFPAVAAASISPSVTLTPTGAPTAGATNYSLGFDVSFAPSDPTDTAKNLTTVFPAGLLSDSTLVNPGSGTLCVATPASDANATNPSCQVAQAGPRPSPVWDQFPRRSTWSGRRTPLRMRRVCCS